MLLSRFNNSISEPSSEIWKTRFMLICHCKRRQKIRCLERGLNTHLRVFRQRIFRCRLQCQINMNLGSTTLVEFTMLMSIVRSIVVRCWQRTIVVTMLLKHELTIVEEKSLLMVVNNDWTMIVEREQLWTMVVDNSCWQGEAQHCWLGAAQHGNKLFTTLIKLFIFAHVRQ